MREVAYRAGDTQHHRYGPGEWMIHDLENTGETELDFVTVEFLDSANAPLAVAETVGACGPGGVERGVTRVIRRQRSDIKCIIDALTWSSLAGKGLDRRRESLPGGFPDTDRKDREPAPRGAGSRRSGEGV